MADEKLNTGPEAQTEEAPAPAVADPAHGEAAVPEHQPEQAGPAEPGDVVISAEQIDALMAEKRQAARALFILSCYSTTIDATKKRDCIIPFRNKKGTIRSNTNYFCINSCNGSMLVYLSRNCLRKRFPINCQSDSCCNASIISAL